MAVVLKPMTAEEYAEFYKTSFENHVKELMEEESLPREKAEKETAAELSQMLPDGKETAGSFLLTIHRTPAPAPVGYIWTIHEETDGIKQSFLCDFLVYEECRRRGYAEESLRLIEKAEAEAGCEESVLFVKNSNPAAEELYKKCGYRFLRDENYGKYMKKRLGRAAPGQPQREAGAAK